MTSAISASGYAANTCTPSCFGTGGTYVVQSVFRPCSRAFAIVWCGPCPFLPRCCSRVFAASAFTFSMKPARMSSDSRLVHTPTLREASGTHTVVP